MWSWHPSGQYILVPQAAPEPIRTPQGVRAYAPNPANGYGQPPSNVVPFRRHETCQLVRPGVDRFGRPADWYADFLSSVPDLDPAMVNGRVGFDVNGLVPTPQDEQQLAQLHHPRDASDRNPNARASADPAMDARGTRGLLPQRAAPLLVVGGAGPGEPDAA